MPVSAYGWWETETATGGVARAVSYTYDSDGNRASLGVPGYTFSYDYTVAGPFSATVNNTVGSVQNIDPGQIGRISLVREIDELRPFDDATRGNVEAGDDTGLQHIRRLARTGASVSAPRRLITGSSTAPAVFERGPSRAAGRRKVPSSGGRSAMPWGSPSTHPRGTPSITACSSLRRSA